MRLVLISDTHGRHDELDIPAGDVIIHAGDSTPYGAYEHIEAFMKWFSDLDIEHKICIAGNHDKLFQRDHERAIGAVPDNVFYLQDSSACIGGIYFYGSPWQPEFGRDWVFNAKRGPELEAIWDRIPANTDVLITHGPPLGTGDTVPASRWSPVDLQVGCEDLKRKTDSMNLKLHVFGHIHEGYGVYGNKVNASMQGGSYGRLVNKPVVFDI
jgi:predicted phosphohydrolase